MAGMPFEVLSGWTRFSTDLDLSAIFTIRGLVGAAFLGYFFLLLKRSDLHTLKVFTTES